MWFILSEEGIVACWWRVRAPDKFVVAAVEAERRVVAAAIVGPSLSVVIVVVATVKHPVFIVNVRECVCVVVSISQANVTL